MARRREVLDDLFKPILDAGRFTIWCKEVAHLSPWTVLRLRLGMGERVSHGTVLAIVAGLAAEGIRVSEERVRAAIDATRAAATAQV